MTTMYQYRVSWSIPNAGPSVSTFYLLGGALQLPNQAAASFRTLFDGLKGGIPNEVTLSFSDEMMVMTAETGQPVGINSVTAPAPVTGTASGAWASGSGMRTDWLTGVFQDGRQIRGRTFFVPMAANSYGTDGRILPTSISTLTGLAADLVEDLDVAGMPLGVWSRPRAATEAKPARQGSIHGVTALTVSGVVATLRGRKY